MKISGTGNIEADVKNALEMVQVCTHYSTNMLEISHNYQTLGCSLSLSIVKNRKKKKVLLSL